MAHNKYAAWQAKFVDWWDKLTQLDVNKYLEIYGQSMNIHDIDAFWERDEITLDEVETLYCFVTKSSRPSDK